MVCTWPAIHESIEPCARCASVGVPEQRVFIIRVGRTVRRTGAYLKEAGCYCCTEVRRSVVKINNAPAFRELFGVSGRSDVDGVLTLAM